MFWKVLRWLSTVVVIALCGLAAFHDSGDVGATKPGKPDMSPEQGKKFNF
jgi:hypothetical protein